ncbi:MAG: capsular polysaccharide biosynthesis protein [Planctomycetota bacterium]|jgi:capsular polysaccharide biosynthesis protein
MAVHIDSSSSVDEFIRVLKRRIWWIVVPFLLIATFGIAFAVIVPRKYVASTRLMVHDTRSDAGVGKDSTAEGRVAQHTIKSRRRVVTVLDRLGWEEWQDLTTEDSEGYIEKIDENLSVATPPIDRNAGQQLVEIEFSHTERDKAYEFLLLLTDLWKEEVLEKTRNTLKEQLEKAESSRREQERLSTELLDKIAGIRQRYGIRPGENNGPYSTGPTAPEFEQLEDVRLQIASVSDEIATTALQVNGLVGRYERLDGMRLEDVAVIKGAESKEITKLVDAIATAESTIELSGWLPENSRYKKAIRQVEEMRSRLFALRESEPLLALPAVEVVNQEKVDLGNQIAVLDTQIETNEARLELLQAREVSLSAKTQELQTAFADIDDLLSRRSRATSVAAAVALRYSKLKGEVDYLEGPAGNPFSELEAVHASTRPTEPNPFLIGIFAIFAGLAVGLGLAVLLEYSKSVFRSVTDVSRSMTVPVLGTINHISTRSEIRRLVVQRVSMSVLSISFVGLVGYVLWAYTSRQELLSDGLLEGITNLREALK